MLLELLPGRKVAGLRKAGHDDDEGFYGARESAWGRDIKPMLRQSQVQDI